MGAGVGGLGKGMRVGKEGDAGAGGWVGDAAPIPHPALAVPVFYVFLPTPPLLPVSLSLPLPLPVSLSPSLCPPTLPLLLPPSLSLSGSGITGPIHM